MKKRYYIKKKEIDPTKSVWDREYDKIICRCYFMSDAIKIKKALNFIEEINEKPTEGNEK
jgi:hypothetical protein